MVRSRRAWSLPILKLLALMALAAGACGARTYYIDSGAGRDAASGASPTTAWRSLRPVAARDFNAGDRILFQRGTRYAGTLWPKGSGNAKAPIVIDAYGEGPLPVIQAGPGAEAAFRLFNQEYWTVRHLELIGGDPHGVFISGSRGVLHGIHLQNLVVHGVTGKPKTKESGLVIIVSGGAAQRFDDVLVDGVTAYGTSQWAGVMVGGVAHGFLPATARSTNVVIRNTIVHDVAGDGIVLFQVNGGTIEDCAAWYTGMQQTETIGTPNAIWTWMCRQCTVRRNEAFLTDSPGVDGGAFDIDYGDNDNIVEDSYGHDTQGYCLAVFGAGSVTRNSIVRRNVCADNGRSPRLAATQGAVFLYTWNGGKLKGVEISDNRIFWNPPIAAPAVVNTAAFEGAAPHFARNSIMKAPPPFKGSAAPKDMPDMNLHDAKGQPVRLNARPGGWRLYGFVPQSGDGAAILASAYRQFHAAGLDLVLIVAGSDSADWNLGKIPVLFDDASARAPAAMLADPDGGIVWQHDGPISPGDLGLALRAHLGNPDYAQLISER